METINIISLIIIVIIIIILIIPDERYYTNSNNQTTLKKLTDQYVISKDLDYFNKFSEKIISNLINNNKLDKPINTKNKILFITYDNRDTEEYVLMHNYNMKHYTDLYDYEYKFYNKCNDNVYWCKIYMVLDALEKNIYDYVIWLDSDTIIKNFKIDIGNVFNKFSSHIFIGSDNNNNYDLTNAGVFAIKNSKIGKQFLKDCADYPSDLCLNSDGTLKGIWAATCYEQGVMNILIADKYQKYTTVLTNNIIFNYNVCSDDVFIMHLYASSSNYRERCFHSKNPKL